jgi:hypothetical protein
LHGAYHYYFVRIDGKLKKRYLKPDEVEAAQVACKARRESERASRTQIRHAQLTIREIRDRLNELIKGISLTQER